MRVKQIKAELLERRIDFSDCFDKEGLEDKLVKARAGLISAPPPPSAPRPQSAPTMRGTAKGDFEFGAETRQGEEEQDLEDAFKAAGWTGEQSGSTPVDTARSPGMNRNFGNVPQSDFKKPYSRGG